MQITTEPDAPQADPWVRGVFLLIGAVAFVAARFFPFGALPTMCAFKRATDHPCLACGMTRSWVHMSHGHAQAAVIQNPAGSVLFVAAVLSVTYLTLRSLRLIPALRLQTSAGEAWTIRGIIIAVLLANWAYVWISGVA